MAELDTLGLIGAGNMGGALLRGVAAAGLVAPDSIWVADAAEGKAAALAEELGAHAAASNAEVLSATETIILAVKPQNVAELLAEIAPGARPEHLFISIAAGIPIAMMQKTLGPAARIVRVMPNTPSMLGHGAAGAARGPAATSADLKRTLAIFQAVGVAVEVDESQINAVTGLSGSGPAYVFYLIEALTAAGWQAGLAPDVADQLSRQTVLGAAVMAQETGQDPAELRRQVTSPGGTTEAGLRILSEADFPGLIARTVARAAERGEELGKLLE